MNQHMVRENGGTLFLLLPEVWVRDGQAFTVFRDYGCQTSRKARTGKGTDSQVTIKVAGACGRNIDACDHNDNRDLT